MTRFRILYEEHTSSADLVDAGDEFMAIRLWRRQYDAGQSRNVWHQSSGPVNVEALEIDE